MKSLSHVSFVSLGTELHSESLLEYLILIQDLLGREGGFGILHLEDTEEEGTSSTGKISAGLSSSRCTLKDPQKDSPVDMARNSQDLMKPLYTRYYILHSYQILIKDLHTR